MSDKSDDIKKILANIDLPITDEQASLLLLYYEKLIETNKVMNLTAVTEFEDVVQKHFADSLTLARAVNVAEIETLTDVGTGAGFPGLVLAVVYPHIQVTLMDSLNKRIVFLNGLIEEMALGNVRAVHGRAEDLARNHNYREGFDAVVSRAVANLSTLSEYCLPFTKTGGVFVAYKSLKAGEEIENAEKAIKQLGGRLEKVESFDLFGMERSLVVIRKAGKTPKVYPRKAGTPAKNPL